jgi:hypothetical protein
LTPVWVYFERPTPIVECKPTLRIQCAMKHRKQEPTAIPGFIRGSEIDLSSWKDGSLAIDEIGEAYCILGYRLEEQPSTLPYYSPSVAVRDHDGRSSYRFVRLFRGTLGMAGFFRDDRYYRFLDDRRLVLPTGTDAYFGVVSRDLREEDTELSRSVFGGTVAEIRDLAKAMSRIAGRSFGDTVQMPRVTFSKTRNNRCDISGCLIPRNFPYVAFEGSQHDWGHVSLHGLYRLVSFLAGSLTASPIFEALVEAGVTAESLHAVLSNTDGNFHPIGYDDYDL